MDAVIVLLALALLVVVRAAAGALTTREKERLALTVPCPLHEVPAGTRCPGPQGGWRACMTRREAVLDAHGRPVS